MSAKDIISAHEREQREILASKQTEADSEKLRRRLNAQKVEEHLQTVIMPVFEATKADVISSGYECGIESVRLHDTMFDEKHPTFIMRLRIQTSGSKKDAFVVLEYRGDFDDMTLTKQQSPKPPEEIGVVDMREVLGNSMGEPLRHFGSERVQQDVDRFLVIAFPSEAARKIVA